MGEKVGALPDGRKAGEPLSEGGISPYQGRNISGPTATMRSVAKVDHTKLTGGSVLNMRFNPDALKDQSKMNEINGISISPKKEFNILKLWLRNNTEDYTSFVKEYPIYIMKDKSIIKKHLN